MSLVLEALLLQIPSTIIGLYVVFLLQRRDMPLAPAIKYGAVLGTFVTAFRLLPVSFSLHVPVVTITMLLLARYVASSRWSMSLFATLVVQLLGFTGEGLIAMPLLAKAGIGPADFAASPVMLALGGWISNIPLLVLLSGLLFARRKANAVARR
ncbi:MAG TPA: hypothetical protein VD969_02695 [Symbiobacteriaceae bacterium]|nr:hypothetical protein [Symbiobacteriaceae bacterium]